MNHRVSAALAALLLIGACSRSQVPGSENDSAAAAPQPASFRLTSTAFRAGDSIPPEFTCDGANQSPPLAWTGAPPSTKSYALIVDDPDAPGGTFVHWVVFDIPPPVDSLPAGVPQSEQVAQPGSGRQGVNGFGHGNLGYGGPCPPKGAPHHYHFRLFALDGAIDAKSPASRDDVVKAMRGHELGHTQLVALYSRR